MRTAIISLMSFTLAWFVPRIERPGTPPAVVAKADTVQEFLELSADQQKRLQELASQLRTKAQGSEQHLESKQKALRQVLASDNADPLAAGKALLELEVAKLRSERTSEELRAEAVGLLTPAQREKLNVLEQASKLHSLTRQAMGMFLIAPPDAVVSGTGPLGMFPPRKRSGKLGIPSAT